MAVKPILKQFAAWGTDLRRKYQDDLFFRTTINVIALQAALIVLVVGLVAWTLTIANAEVIALMVRSFPSGVENGLIAAVHALQIHAVENLFLGTTSLICIFGVLLAYATLRPARETLHYQKLFISNIAHELRTPLSTIKTGTEVALLDDRLSPDLRETFTETVVELDRISDIINNLLSLNRLLRPEHMEFTGVDLNEVIERVIERVGALATEQGVSISLSEHEYSMVHGNAAALEQVVENILKNAIHYSPKGQHRKVAVSTTLDPYKSVVFSVADQGIGISQKDLFHIFEPFYRADLSRTRSVKKGGSGLGLAIVSEIVRLHRGKIHIQSMLGKGTTVSVYLPSVSSPTPRRTRARSSSEGGVHEMSVDFSKSKA